MLHRLSFIAALDTGREKKTEREGGVEAGGGENI